VTSPEREDEFETYLKRRSPLHRRVSELERLEPPQDLDRIVLRQAREAIQATTPVPLYKPPRWALPTGLAATLVLSFAILLHVGRTTPETTAVIAARAQPHPQSSDLRARFPETRNELPDMTLAARRARSRVAESKVSAAQAAEARRLEKSLSAAPPAIAASAATSPAAAASSAVSAPYAFAEPGRIATPTNAPIPENPGSLAVPIMSAGARAGSSSAGNGAVKPDPADWLRRIQQLRAQGHAAQAEREWRRFHAAYPDYVPSTSPRRSPAAASEPAR
jgi:hypothetical protein